MVGSLFPVRLRDAMVKQREKVLLGPINTTLRARGSLIIIGPNGAGKTTLLRLIHGLERTHEGEVRFANQNAHDVRSRQSFVFQKPIMLRRNVLDNVAYPLLVRNMSKRHARKAAQAMLEKVGLAPIAAMRCTNLSGGEAQKLAIARALVTHPELLLLDEPTASLDSASTREIETLIAHAAKEGVQIVMTTHNMGQAQRIGRYVLFLNKAKLIEHTSADRFWTEPQSEDARRFIHGEIV